MTARQQGTQETSSETRSAPVPRAPSDEPIAPAWATRREDGTWGVQWEVPGATEYLLYRAPTLAAAWSDGQEPAARDTDPAALTMQEEPDTAQFIVAAYGPESFLPLAVSQVGAGDRNAKADIHKYLKEWKSWKKLRPHQEDKTEDSEWKVSYPNGTRRSEHKREIVRNPKKAITFNPNENMLFPGAIIQSKPAITDGHLSSAQVDEKHRAKLQISINRLLGKGEKDSPSFKTVKPTKGAVSSAINDIVQDKVAESTDINSEQTVAMNSVEAALELDISAKYGGGAGSLKVEANRTEGQNTVVAFLYENAFTASCDLGNAAQFFNDNFTKEEVQKLVDGGYMGEDNPPLVVSNVVYGRMLMFSVTATASETDLKAALKASYDGFVASANAELNLRYKKILQESTVKIEANGIEPREMKSLLANGSIKADFFDRDKKPYKAYGVIGYTLHTLDGVPAKISEACKFNRVSYDYGTTLVASQIRLVTLHGTTTSTHKEFEITIDGRKIKVTAEQPLMLSKPWFREDKNAPKVEPFKITSLRFNSVDIPVSSVTLHPEDQAWTSDWKFASGTLTLYKISNVTIVLDWKMSRMPAK